MSDRVVCVSRFVSIGKYRVYTLTTGAGLRYKTVDCSDRVKGRNTHVWYSLPGLDYNDGWVLPRLEQLFVKGAEEDE